MVGGDGVFYFAEFHVRCAVNIILFHPNSLLLFGKAAYIHVRNMWWDMLVANRGRQEDRRIYKWKSHLNIIISRRVSNIHICNNTAKTFHTTNIQIEE